MCAPVVMEEPLQRRAAWMVSSSHANKREASPTPANQTAFTFPYRPNRHGCGRNLAATHKIEPRRTADLPLSRGRIPLRPNAALHADLRHRPR